MKIRKISQIIHCESEIQVAMDKYLIKHNIKHLREVAIPER